MAERPAENWFLGRGSKSGQNEMLAVFRRQTREEGVVLGYRVVSPRWRFSGRFGLKRTDNARYASAWYYILPRFPRVDDPHRDI